MPVATEIVSLMHLNTSGRLARGEHTTTTISLCIDFITMLSRRNDIASVSYQEPQVIMTLTWNLLKACGPHSVFLHLIDILSNFAPQVLLILCWLLMQLYSCKYKKKKKKKCFAVSSVLRVH